MTPAQLDKLAVDVMGWERKDFPVGGLTDEVFECWVTKDGEPMGSCSQWHPDTDLNQALPLLDAYNERHPMQINYEYYYDRKYHEPSYEIKGGKNDECIDRACDTKDLASEICRAILERLG